MASRVIYPPIVDSYLPAFSAETDNAKCRIPFRLSKFNSSKDIKSVHVSIVKQNTGKNVVNINNNEGGRYRSTGIIINVPFQPIKDTEEDDLFYIELSSDDIDIGWTIGWIYKVQIRFCAAENYNPARDGGQAAWLNAHSFDFSEWSTVTIIKAIGAINYAIPVLNIDTKNIEGINEEKSTILYAASLNAFGHFYEDSRDTSELIYSYQFLLYDAEGRLIEDSHTILANQYQDNRSFSYLFKTELENEQHYKLGFKFETINHFIGGFYSEDKLFNFTVEYTPIDRIDCKVLTAENDPDGLLTGLTTIAEEEEEGRIGLKLYSESSLFSGNICIRRTDAKSHFKKWDDIKIITLKAQNINDLDMIYDYTVESGVWYKYAVQGIDKDGSRGVLTETNVVMRNFNYSYLFGQDGRQLKLMFDNSMNSFRYQVSESKTDTLGGVYPVVTRNAATKYKTFPINGLISFWMDENKLFCDKKVVYNYDDVVELYEQYNKDNFIMQYDYIYERDFRQQVLEFLYDGEVKLFKSPTEGNVLVRLTDINCTPNQSLDRMIYSFTSTASEMAAPTMENYLAYGFYTVGEYKSDFGATYFKLGQIQADFPAGGDLISEIYKKYDKSKYKTIQKVDVVARSKNREMFYIIEILNEAIEKGKKVRFNYNEYMMSNEMTPRFQGKQFLINPYFLVNSRGKYYLVCNYDKYNDLSNYKIECISNISITDEPIKPISKLDNTEGFSKKKYIDEHIYMTFGKSVSATLKIDKSKYISDLIDWFGDSIQIKLNENDELTVSLKVNEQALIFWAMQYGAHVEVLKPIETREKIKELLKNMNEKYEVE